MTPRTRKPSAPKVVLGPTPEQTAATAREIAARIDASPGRRAATKVEPPKISRERRAGQTSSDLELAIAEMKPEFVRCRDGNHHWMPHTVRTASYGYERIRKCDSCMSFRSTLLDHRGYVIEDKGINYTDGYVLVGLGRLSGDDRAAVRLNQVKREVTQTSRQ